MRKLNIWLITLNLCVKIVEIILTLIGIFIFHYRDLIPFSLYLMPISLISFILLYWINFKIESIFLTILIILSLTINIFYTIHNLGVLL